MSSVVQPKTEQKNSNYSPREMDGELSESEDFAESVLITGVSRRSEGIPDMKSPSQHPQQEQRGNMTDFGGGVPLPATEGGEQKTMPSVPLPGAEGGEQKTMPNRSLRESGFGKLSERHLEGISPSSESMHVVPTPGYDETAGNFENEPTFESVDDEEEYYMEAQTQAPGGEVELGELGHKPMISPGQLDSSSIDAELEMEWEQAHKTGGDCDRLYIHRFSLMFCAFIFLALSIACFIFYPDPLELCLHLSLDEEIMKKVLHDEGSYQLNITNPNSIDVHIQGLEISAYYGGVAEENWLLNSEKMDHYIPAHSMLSEKETYTFAQDCTSAVPVATLNGCYNGYRTSITYDIVTTFKACVLSFVCHEGIVSKSAYKSGCPENDVVCTKLEIFQFDS